MNLILLMLLVQSGFNSDLPQLCNHLHLRKGVIVRITEIDGRYMEGQSINYYFLTRDFIRNNSKSSLKSVIEKIDTESTTSCQVLIIEPDATGDMSATLCPTTEDSRFTFSSEVDGLFNSTSHRITLRISPYEHTVLEYTDFLATITACPALQFTDPDLCCNNVYLIVTLDSLRCRTILPKAWMN